jgi:hypothetical protein
MTTDSLPLTAPPGLPDDVSPLGERTGGAFRALSIIVGATGLMFVVSVLVDGDRKQFFHSYLFGYVLALDISLGALFWVLIHHVAGAGWSVGLRRLYENITRAIAPLALLFIPVLIGIYSGSLHEWYDFISQPEPTDPHALHQWHVKHPYFSAPFFLFRIALYFGIWIAYSTAMRRMSEKQDAGGGTELALKMRWWAPSGTLLLSLTATFFAFDLLMSLQYSWFSTIFGVYFWTGGIRGSMSFAVLFVLALRARGYLQRTITIEHLHDVAKMMFGFTVFWAYIAFSQYFLIWYGNMPEETQYYLLRRNGAWYEASTLLPVVNFGVPFVLLLPRANKRNPITLAIAAAWILVAHAFDLYWQVLPVLHRDTIHFHWLDLAAPVFMLAVVVLSTLWGLHSVPLIPIRDVYLNETIGYENETP